jgi:hypothetical protein
MRKFVPLSFVLALALVCLPVSSREIPLKENAGRYYAHTVLQGGIAVGADFLGKYLPVAGMTVYSDEYIFVEVAFFGPASRRADFQTGQFTLRLNGTELTPQPPGMITLANNFPEMEARPEVVLDGGAGNGQIEIGGRDGKPRFPGDDPAHTPTTRPQAPTDSSNGQVQPNQTKPDDLVKAAEFPTGAHALPVGGYLFFHYEGKLKKIKHAELSYQGPLGSATLSLR